MNNVDFLRTCMTTVILDVETDSSVDEIFENITLGRQFEDAEILAKYYKDKNGQIVHEGKSIKIKLFPRTLVLYCIRDEKIFKIRWFYSKKVNKIHIASGLKQETASSYLVQLVNHLRNKIQFINIGNVRKVLVNGLAQAKIGINLYKLSENLEKENMNFVYTPDRHAALKIYTELGTVSVHSTGKILYMGSKTEDMLMQLHEKISNMGKYWNGVPILIGI